jgi:hypothetical protein
MANMLPAPPDPAEEAKTPPRRVGEPGALRMLVVDDNVDMAMSLAMPLELHGH